MIENSLAPTHPAILVIDNAFGEWQVLQFANLGVIAFDDQPGAETLNQKTDPHLLERFHSLCECLDDKAFTVAVNDKPGQQVALRMNKTICVCVGDDLPAPLVCLLKPRTPEVYVDLFVVRGNKPEGDFGISTK